MANWMRVEGRLSDGLPMRAFLAEHQGQLWNTALGDDEHLRDEGEFVSWLAGDLNWECVDKSVASDVLSQAATELEDYFAARRVAFDVPFGFRGTPFQVRVWQQLIQIPFGETSNYGKLAASIGQPTACRAVGAANGRNRLPVFIPCHRVIASGGKLCGFTGGIGLKKRLLAHEAAVLGICAHANTRSSLP